MKRFTFGFLFTLFALTMSAGADPLNAINPAELLRALPATPPEWKCTQSTAKVEFGVAGIPETTVQRSYQVPSPPDVRPATTGTLQLVAMDLGTLGDPQYHPALAQKDPNAFVLGEITGTFRELPNKGAVFSGTIGTRLLVQVTARGMRSEDFKRILGKLDLGALAALEKRLPTTPLTAQTVQESDNGKVVNSRVFTLQTIYIDELNPASSRTTTSNCVDSGP
jgi:hypothetical protein